VTKDDIVLAISNSGNTQEINKLLPIIKQMGTKIISFTGGLNSAMAMVSDVVIDVGVEREACPMGLAPTTSTTATLAMGDALAVVLIKLRQFSQKDFKKFHPGGSLGERLTTKVREVMFTDEHMPVVTAGTLIRDAIMEIDSKGIGATVVIDGGNKILGILTDGDLRRALIKQQDVQNMKVEEAMTLSPKSINEESSAAEALGLMEMYGIMHLVVADQDSRLKGILHLHDLLGREDFKLNGNKPTA
jgi:arabinose-5-phosphate isomerase